jgi:orotidine-5'-phosphate decarboxylase
VIGGKDDPGVEPDERLVFALDVPDAAGALAWVERLRGEVGVFKVGLELFCAEGPSLVRRVAALGGTVFLDLKLHDIPATVARAAAGAVGGGGVRWLTIHAGGGAEMMRAAVAATAGRAGILAVTVLTSLDDASASEAGLAVPIPDLVVRRARLAAACGCAGVVASPLEAAAVRAAVAAPFRIVTPGIRPAGVGAGDQRRTATPVEAIRAGADTLVVGRPIRDAPDPAAAAGEIRRQIGEALAGRGT